MGIYSNGSIFGIQIYNFNEDDVSNKAKTMKYIQNLCKIAALV